MNLDQFLEALTKTRGEWEFDRGCLRHKFLSDLLNPLSKLCPLHVVAGIDSFDTSRAVELLKPTFNFTAFFNMVDNITADCHYSGEALRDRILEAVGLDVNGNPVPVQAPVTRTRKPVAKITLDEFFTILSLSPRRWELTGLDAIEYVPLRSTQRYDPLTYVFMKLHKKVRKFDQYKDVATDLGFDDKTANQLMMAADGYKNKGEDVDELRARMIKCCEPTTIDGLVKSDEGSN